MPQSTDRKKVDYMGLRATLPGEEMQKAMSVRAQSSALPADVQAEIKELQDKCEALLKQGKETEYLDCLGANANAKSGGSRGRGRGQQLAAMTVAQLRQLAAARSLPGRSTMCKADLVAALESAQRKPKRGGARIRSDPASTTNGSTSILAQRGLTIVDDDDDGDSDSDLEELYAPGASRRKASNGSTSPVAAAASGRRQAMNGSSRGGRPVRGRGRK